MQELSKREFMDPLFALATFFLACALRKMCLSTRTPCVNGELFTHHAGTLETSFNCCWRFFFCIVTPQSPGVSSPRIRGEGGGAPAPEVGGVLGVDGAETLQGAYPDARRQLNARGTQASITSRSSLRHFFLMERDCLIK